MSQPAADPAAACDNANHALSNLRANSTVTTRFTSVTNYISYRVSRVRDFRGPPHPGARRFGQRGGHAELGRHRRFQARTGRPDARELGALGHSPPGGKLDPDRLVDAIVAPLRLRDWDRYLALPASRQGVFQAMAIGHRFRAFPGERPGLMPRQLRRDR